jgi:DNA modification methylase
MAGDGGGLTDPDEAPEPPASPVSRPGDVWLLGSHRLMCGDSTSAETVAAALAGAKPHLMVTDPPYGVLLDAAWRDAAGANTKGKSGKGGQHYMEGGKTDTEARRFVDLTHNSCANCIVRSSGIESRRT